MQTTKQLVPIDVPVGWKVVRHGLIQKDSGGVNFIGVNGHVEEWNCSYGSDYFYTILEPDPTYIDTTTEEYRVEVYRQWLRAKTIEYRSVTRGVWCYASAPCWYWNNYFYRVKPEGEDELGPYYLNGLEKVYVPR